jgi:segregation and condensation protein A
MSEAGLAKYSDNSEYSHFFEVQLDVFNGPIDLLLHLVKKNELSIEKVSLARVAEQYLQCLEIVRQFDLDIAGEYLVIAATLVSIKSSVLLNQPVELVEDEEGNLVDPHEELLNRLREAAIYKDGAYVLSRKPWLGFDVFQSAGTLDGVDAPPVRYKPHDAMLLGMAFRRVLEKAGKQDLYTIALEHVSVVERMMELLERLKNHGRAISFEELIKDAVNRISIIGSFVALLELCKRQVILVRQDEHDSEIVIALASGDAAEAAFETGIVSEFDAEHETAQEVVNA